MKNFIIPLTLILALACGGGQPEQIKEEKQPRFQAVMSEGVVIGYNYEDKEEDKLIFIPVDEMPPAAPLTLGE